MARLNQPLGADDSGGAFRMLKRPAAVSLGTGLAVQFRQADGNVARVRPWKGITHE